MFYVFEGGGAKFGKNVASKARPASANLTPKKSKIRPSYPKKTRTLEHLLFL
jgi:hypothetical protein